MASVVRIGLLPGDGIGREVIPEAVKVLESAAEMFGFKLQLEWYPYGADHFLNTGVTLPAGQIERFRKQHDALLLGAFGDPRVPDHRHAAEILLAIRFELDLYINFRPCRLYDARLCPLKGKRESDVDFVVFRENTEGAYAGVGGVLRKGTPHEVGIQQEVHTRRGVERIVRAAFEYATAHSRTEVVMIDKANAMPHGHGLWRRVFGELAQEFPEIRSRSLYVDAAVAELVQAPERFQVLVTNNLFGDIVTDLAAAMQGGLGVAASANRHPGQLSMYEPVHGSAPDIAGSGRANPVGAILSAALLLEDVDQVPAARAVEQAVASCLRQGVGTPDVGGACSTAEVGDAVAQRVRIEAYALS